MGSRLSLREYCEEDLEQRGYLLDEWDYEKNTDITPEKISYGSSNKVWWKCFKGHEWEATIANRTGGNGCPYCSGRRITIGENDFATVCPDLAKEWNYSKNRDLTPKDITKGCGKKLWWTCPEGHEYQSTISHRLNGCNCPYCSNRKILKGYNDLATTNPELYKEWNYEKNTISPYEIPAGTPKKIWWKCQVCGYEWQTSGDQRARTGSGCPRCSGMIATTGVNDLATLYPEIAREWDYERNKGVSPQEIKPYSNKKYWWKCIQRHEYEAPANHRIEGKGCPYCAGQKVWQGFNDLESQKPDLAKEWNYAKNAPLRPSDFTVGSGKKVWWICDKGHEWQASIDNRVKKRGCPICDQENKSSFPEQAIFFYLKKYFPDTVNRDRDTIGMELDIYIPSLKIAIEYDGAAWHDGEKAQDREYRKNNLCIKNGILLIRVREDDISYDDCAMCIRRRDLHSLVDLDRVINEVFDTISSSITPDVDTERDFNSIQEQLVLSEKSDSLEVLFPEVAKQWHPTKNGNTKPSMIKAHSNRKYWWVCEKGHEWQSVVSSRTTGKYRSGCPYCSNQRVLKGYNDFATVYPNLLSEWDYEKNTDVSPEKITARTDKKVWWICSQKHSYQQAVLNKVNGCGCPYCSNKKVHKKINSLNITDPEIIDEWDYDRNNPLTPEYFTRGSGKKVWWKCRNCGYEWQASVNSHVKGHGCPKCALVIPKSVKNKDTGEIYRTLSEAAKSCGLKVGDTISLCCQGKLKTAGGYHWEYVK